MSRCTSEVVVCGVVDELTDETLRLYLEMLSWLPKRRNTVSRLTAELWLLLSIDINLLS